MNGFEAIFLGILQGVTEFLPISSSGHLVLGEGLLGLEVESLKSFDVMVHLGSLLAIFFYFRKDILGLIKGFFKLLGGNKSDPYSKLVLFIIVGTIPAVVAGLTLEDFIDANFRNSLAVAVCMIIVGIVFLFAEKMAKQNKKISWKSGIIIGIVQAFALIPGVSRSGSTIVAGLFTGLKREQAARFSFLLGIPAIAGAGLLTMIGEVKNGGFVLDFWPVTIAFLASFISGLISITFLMKFLKKHSINIFAYYLIAVGLVTFSIDKFS
jgi:undecaprenyl-diphosphatase